MASIPPVCGAAMRSFLRLALVLATLLLVAAGAAAQTLQWSIAPNGPNGYPIATALSALQSRHHVAALDASGNLFIAGTYYSTTSAPFPETSGQFLGKYNADTGAEQWRLTGAVQSTFTAVAVNAAGDAFVTGYYVSGTREHQYLARVSGATGAIMWERRGVVPDPTDATETWGTDIVLDPSGNPIVLGTYARRALVTKLDANTGA